MINNKSILAIIPARAGSKRLPKKNIKYLLGKPLIAWSIEAAKKSKYIDKTIVSTDSRKIADISKKYGAEAPFIRPQKLAGDNSPGIDVVIHAINWTLRKLKKYDLILVLQPTSPLRTSKDIDEAIELLVNIKARSIVSVCEAEHHPYWSNILPQDLSMKSFIKRSNNKNKQKLPVFYRLNGSIYIGYADYILKNKSYFGKKTYAYVMDCENSIDIDSEIDFNLAEILLKKSKKA